MPCEFAKECDLYSSTSFTCKHGSYNPANGSYYCGKARHLALQREERNRQVDEEMLFQQTGKVKHQ